MYTTVFDFFYHLLPPRFIRASWGTQSIGHQSGCYAVNHRTSLSSSTWAVRAVTSSVVVNKIWISLVAIDLARDDEDAARCVHRQKTIFNIIIMDPSTKSWVVVQSPRWLGHCVWDWLTRFFVADSTWTFLLGDSVRWTSRASVRARTCARELITSQYLRNQTIHKSILVPWNSNKCFLFFFSFGVRDPR